MIQARQVGWAGLARRSRWWAAGLAGAVGLTLSLGVAGCTSGGEAPVPGPSSTQLSGDTGGLAGASGARTALTDVVCKADDKGNWSGSGQLTNEGKETASYLVTFSVTVTKSSELVNSKKSTIKLKPGEKKEVKFEDLATTKVAAAHQCVPRVIRGTS